MDRQAIEQLRLDRRLIGRRNWIAAADLEAALAALPDVSDKIAEVESETDAEAGADPSGS